MTQPDEVPTRSADELIRLFSPDPQSLSEVGVARYCGAALERHVRWVVEDQRWLVWQDTHWEPDDARASKTYALLEVPLGMRRDDVLEWDDEAGRREAGLRALAAYDSVRKRRTLLEALTADPRLRVEVDRLDAAASEITCLSGTVNLDTGAVRRTRPEDLVTRRCRTIYDPDARSQLLDEYLDTFIPEDKDRRYVFAVLGDALRVGNRHRWLPIFWGDTTSGKSQLFAALHDLLDGYVCTVGSSIFRGNLDDKPRPDLVLAMDTRIAYAQEASRSWSLHADQVKRLTGQDRLPYRQLHERLVNRTPRFTPVLVTNTLPRITGADRALKRRILAIHMDRSLDPLREDPRKRDAFMADPRVKTALLALLIRGASDPTLADVPERFALATMNARAGLDHVDEFLEWMAEEAYLVALAEGAAAATCVKASELFACYRYWVRNMADRIDRQDELGRTQFGQALRDRGWNSTKSAGVRWLGWGLAPAVPLEIRAQF